MESRYIHKSHNVSVLMYHLVCAAKYRRVVMGEHVDQILRQACLEIEKRWEMRFLEIGLDRDHAHFLIQSVPTYSVTRIVTTVKSVIAREVFAKAPEVKQQLWGGEIWGKEYFANTVGQHGSEKVIAPEWAADELEDFRQHLWQQELGLGLAQLGQTLNAAAAAPKTIRWKLELAYQLRQASPAPYSWIAKTLKMGAASSVRAALSRRLQQPAG